MLIEMARIRLHGFSDKEVQQACTSMMSDVESAYIERDQDYSQVRKHCIYINMHNYAYMSTVHTSAYLHVYIVCLQRIHQLIHMYVSVYLHHCLLYVHINQN